MNAEWHRAQIDQALESFRFLVGLVVTFWGFTIGADAALVVYGLTVHSLPALYIAACLPLVCLAAWLAINRSMVTFAYIALRSELELGVAETGVVQTYGRTALPELTSKLHVVASLDPADAPAELRRMTRRLRLGRRVVMLFVGLSAVQIAVAVLTANGVGP